MSDDVVNLARQLIEADKDAEIARLRELLRGIGANRYWEGRYRDAIEECARMAEGFYQLEGHGNVIAIAIRALKS